MIKGEAFALIAVQDWTEMLLRMYIRWADQQGFKTKVVEKSPGDEAGLKSATVEIEGQFAYGYLSSEKGTHRLVRQSPFNAKGLRQVSFLRKLPQIPGHTVFPFQIARSLVVFFRCLTSRDLLSHFVEE